MTEPISAELLGLPEEPERESLEKAWVELSLANKDNKAQPLGPLQQYSAKLHRMATTLLQTHRSLRGEVGGQVRVGDNYIRVSQNPGERSLLVRKWNDKGENVMCTFVLTEQSQVGADQIKIETQDSNPAQLEAVLQREKLQTLTRKEAGKEPQTLNFKDAWNTPKPDLGGFEV